MPLCLHFYVNLVISNFFDITLYVALEVESNDVTICNLSHFGFLPQNFSTLILLVLTDS